MPPMKNTQQPDGVKRRHRHRRTQNAATLTTTENFALKPLKPKLCLLSLVKRPLPTTAASAELDIGMIVI